MGNNEIKTTAQSLVKEIGIEVENFQKRCGKNIQSFIKPVLILFSILGVSSLAIFRANFNYVDDALRVYNGNAGWIHFSRYISEYFSHIIHTANSLADISPLPQLVALFIVSIAGIMLIYSITKNPKIPFLGIIAVIPLGFSPYFMECLSYKYDSPYMAISILAAVFPILFFHKKPLIIGIVSALSPMLVCMSYQAAIGIYPMLILFLAFLEWNQKEDWREIGKRVLCAAGGFILGLLIFRLFMMRPIAEEDYVSGSLFPMMELIPGAIGRYGKYFVKIWTDFPVAWRVLIIIICVSFLILSIVQSKRNKIGALFVSVSVFIGMACLSYGAFPFLQKEFYPARAMYGFGVFLAAIAVYVATQKKTFLLKLVPVALSWCFVVFAFVYGNALNVQKEYSDFRMEQLIHDLSDLEVFQSGEEITVDIDGSYARSPLLNMPDRQFPLLQKLVPQPFCSIEWIWSTMEFSTKYGVPNMKVTVDLPEMELPLLKDTMYQTIYGDDKNICVVLK